MIHLLHGALGSASDWDAFSPGLHPHPTRSYDLLEGEITPLEGIGAELNARAAEGDVLLGYSLGGRLALHALLAEPSPWSAAVIISAHTGLATADQRTHRQKDDAHWAALARQDWEGFLRRWEAQAVFGGAALPWDRTAMVGSAGAVARSFEQWGLGRQRDLLPELPEIACPVLWLAGEQDEKFATIATAACAALPNASLEIIPGCGHRMPWEKPERATELIQSFLSR